MAPQLPQRQLGRDGPQVNALGLGLMGLSTNWYGELLPDEERLAFLDAAVERGATTWDSARLYGDNEELVGKWFEKTGKRKEIFLATKFGVGVGEGGHMVTEGMDSPEQIREQVEDSLKKLKTDYIDLLYCHRVSGKVPIETIVKTMQEFVDAGKVRYLGLCEINADSLRRAAKVAKISAYQVEYSPFDTDIEVNGALDACRENGIAVIAYSPLGRGMLTGQYKSKDDFDAGDFRRMFPRFNDENFPKNLALVEKLEAIAKTKGATAGQLALAWLMKQGEDILPIPGTKKVKYLDENLAATNIDISDEEVASIRQSVQEAGGLAGDRTVTAIDKTLQTQDTPPLTTLA